MPSEASVMPSWQRRQVLAEVVEQAQHDAAPRLSPSLASSSMRERRVRTSANSAATKNPLARTSRTTAMRKSAVKRRQ